MNISVSFVLPAKNEEKGLSVILPELKQAFPESEIIVVDDGSGDQTGRVAADLDVTVVRHPYSMGNGAAIKSGVRRAESEYVVCMDADGQHTVREMKKLFAKLEEGYEMVVGARSRYGQANRMRLLANFIYNRLASWMVGHKVHDLTSGVRVFKRDAFMEFISLLPNKFSYPTTLTMAFFRAGYSVGYVSIAVEKRGAETKSHIHPLKDGMRFLLIIFKIGTLFSPLKIFIPISFLMFVSALGYYINTYLSDQRFTNMGVLLFTTSVIIFLIGLVSEQITALMYKK